MGYNLLEYIREPLEAYLSQNNVQNCDSPVKIPGPVVQSIVSLTSLLRGHLVKCFTTL